MHERRCAISRVLLEQAKGVIAHVAQVDMGQAFTLLRRYARDHNLPLTAVAEDVVTREMAVPLLVEHVRSASAESL